MSVFTLFNV